MCIEIYVMTIIITHIEDKRPSKDQGVFVILVLNVPQPDQKLRVHLRKEEN